MFETRVLDDLALLVRSLASLEEPTTDAERIDRVRAWRAPRPRSARPRSARPQRSTPPSGPSEPEPGSGPISRAQGSPVKSVSHDDCSPHQGAIQLGLARILTTEMPHTLAAMTAGILNEWRATLLVRETACLTLEDRRTVDRLVAGDQPRLELMGDRALVAEVQRLALSLDAESVVRRARRAESERTVTIRPPPTR